MIYWFTRWAAYFFVKFFFRLKVYGDIPRGGVILCPNHLSNFDPPVVAASTQKSLYFMAKKELFKNPIFGWYLRHLHTFPVDRTTFDRGAFRKAISLLNENKNVIIFPEGTRKKDPSLKLGEIKRAVSYIIYNTKNKIVPVCIKGTDKWMRLRRFEIKFGEPFDVEERGEKFSKEVAEKISQKIRQKILELMDE